MNYSTRDLKNYIVSILSPLISERGALFDAPYYKNIGDVLIWHGELSFLRDTSKELEYTCSEKTCTYPDLPNHITILFQGGGNIGDLYINHTKFLLSVVEKYPNHRMIVFPQTVYFKDKYAEKEYLSKIASHKDIHFCCRDYKSYEIVTTYFHDRAILLPDMAFCINPTDFASFKYKPLLDSLYIKRNDVEKLNSNLNFKFDRISDWPPFSGQINTSILINTLYDRICPIIKSAKLYHNWDNFALNYFRWGMIKSGVNFISPYNKIYSERLHGAILSILLGKDTTIIDNSYGKNSTFYDTWLKNFPNVKIYREGVSEKIQARIE